MQDFLSQKLIRYAGFELVSHALILWSFTLYSDFFFKVKFEGK